MDKTKVVKLTAVEEFTLGNIVNIHETLSSYFYKKMNVILDFSSNREIDTSGFQLLLYWKKYAATHKIGFRIVNHSSALLSTLGTFGSVGLFGDKVHLQPGDREQYGLNYGLKKEVFS